MRNLMRTTGKACFLVLVMVAAAVAQNRLQSSPSPAVVGPAYDVSVGYSHLSMPMPSAGRVNFNGLDFSGNIGLRRRWGATIDSSYFYAHDVLSTRHQGYMFSLHGGPMFYPIEHGNTRLFVRALAGAALVDGAVPISKTQNLHGWLFQPSYVLGGGVEHSVSEQLAIRVIGDYLRTGFYNAADTTQPQNNLRLTVSFVLRLKERPHKSTTQLW